MRGKTIRGPDEATRALVEKLLTAAPRALREVERALHERARAGEDLAPLLPELSDIETSKRSRVLRLLTITHIRQERADSLLSLLDGQSIHQICASFLDWGNAIKSRGMVAALLPTVLRYLVDQDVELAAHATYALLQWAKRELFDPWDHAERLLPLVGDRRRSRSLRCSVGPTVLSTLELAIASTGDGRLQEVLRPSLAAKDSKVRGAAAELLAARALEKGEWNIATDLLESTDAAVRNGAGTAIEKGARELQGAESILDRAFVWKSRRAREAVARAVAAALEPRHIPPPKVKDGLKLLMSNKVEERRAGARFSGFLIDMVDCRSAAPALAMALADDDAKVREHAALSLYYAFDLQGDLDVVRCTLPCIRAARSGAVGEMAKNLDAVVKGRKRR